MGADSVRQTDFTMTNEPAPAGTDTPLRLTVLFADIADSTRLYRQLGNDRALARVEGCMSQLETITHEHEGKVIKTVGDEIMCRFATPELAVQAAMRMQLDRADTGLQLCIGLQHGELIERYGDVFGDTVNVASRLTSIAKPGQILTTIKTIAELPTTMKEATRQHERVVLKGIAEEVDVVEILWQQDDAVLTMMGDTPLSTGEHTSILTLNGPDGEVVVGGELDVATFGRDPDCTIRISHPKASRHHARIEQRRNNFVLIDRSTNGTWICFDQQAPFRLRLEEAVLRGSGVISFGESPDSATAQPMRFEVA